MARFVMDVTSEGATFVEVSAGKSASGRRRERKDALGLRGRTAPLVRAPPRKRVWLPAFREEMSRLRSLQPGWGRLDCVTLCRDMVVALTGADAGAWPSGWADEASARRVMARHGFADVGAVLAAVLEEIPPAFARQGDVGTVEGPDGPAGCIVIGETLAIVRADGLSVTAPRHLLTRAFRV